MKATQEYRAEPSSELDALDRQDDARDDGAGHVDGVVDHVEALVEDVVAGATQSYHDLATKSPLLMS